MRIFKHPIKKLTLAAAFGGGYVLGAKAGRERYEQILQRFNQVKGDPRVQDVAGRAEDLVRETAAKVSEDPRVQDVAAKVSEDPRVQDVAAKAQAVFQDAKSAVESEVEDTSTDVKAQPTPPVPAPPTSNAPTPKDQPGVHRLLVDEHVDEPDEVVYSSGPDVSQPLVDDERDTV